MAPTASLSNLALGLPLSSENAPAGGRMSCRSTLYAELQSDKPKQTVRGTKTATAEAEGSKQFNLLERVRKHRRSAIHDR